MQVTADLVVLSRNKGISGSNIWGDGVRGGKVGGLCVQKRREWWQSQLEEFWFGVVFQPFERSGKETQLSTGK